MKLLATAVPACVGTRRANAAAAGAAPSQQLAGSRIHCASPHIKRFTTAHKATQCRTAGTYVAAE
jgi:hypothetical protein